MTKKKAKKPTVKNNPSAKKPVYTMNKNVKGPLSRPSKLQRDNPELWRDVSSMEIWDTITFPNGIKHIVSNFRKTLEEKGWKFEMIKQNDKESIMRRLSSRNSSIVVRKKKSE